MCDLIMLVLRGLASMQDKADQLMTLHDDLVEIKAEHGAAIPDKTTLRLQHTQL